MLPSLQLMGKIQEREQADPTAETRAATRAPTVPEKILRCSPLKPNKP